MKQKLPTSAAERPHSNTGPSSLKNLASCPSFTSAEDEYDPTITEAGNRCHDAAETRNFDLCADEYEEGYVRLALTYVDGLKKPKEVLLEPVLRTGHPHVWGYADRVHLHPANKHADLIDYKFGWVFQGDAAENIQGKAYTIGLFLEFLWLEQVTVHFIYPRTHTVTTHTFLRSDLPQLETEVYRIADRREKLAGKVFEPNFNVCRLCGNRFACKELEANFLPAVKRDRNWLDAPITLPDPRTAETDEELLLIDKAGSMVKKWGEQYYNLAKSRLKHLMVEEGRSVPGLTLKFRRNKPILTDRDALTKVCLNYGLSSEDILAASEPSVADLAKAVHDRSQKGEKGKRSAQFRADLEINGAVEVPRVAAITRDKNPELDDVIDV